MNGLNEDSIKLRLTESVENVFKTMLSLNVELLDFVPPSSNNLQNQPHETIRNGSIVAAGIGFSGTLNGFAYLCSLEPLAKKLTCAFLGFTPEEIEKEGIATVNDAMGELSNMTTGDFKNKLSDLGYSCTLSIPALFNGEKLTFHNCKGSDINRYTFVFKVLDESFVLELFFKS